MGGWLSGIFSGINNFVLRSSSAIKSDLNLWAFLLAFSILSGSDARNGEYELGLG